MAAVASRNTNNSPHLGSRMSSPKEPKRSIPAKVEEFAAPKEPSARPSSPPRPEPAPAANATTQAGDNEAKANTSTAPSNTNAQTLGPPPKPSEGPDYFNTNHNALQREPNPFEQSFGQPSSETPGILPPVASLTSPSSLLPGGTPGWGNSLRSGPLSPAMLTGPTGDNDYFSSSHFGRGFPTPNESSLRTGLTPGGGGSMFPAPSPNSQALFNSLQSAGATPGTLDFHRTAINAAAASQFNKNNTSNPTSQPQEQQGQTGMDQKQFQPQQPPQQQQQQQQHQQNSQHQQQQQQQDPFVHDGNDAANGLLYLSQQASNGRPVNNGFAVPGQHSQIQTNMGQMGNMGTQSQETSPMTRRAPKNSIGSVSGSADTGDFSESAHSEDAKPPTRSKAGKKGSSGKATNNRRKADEAPSKVPASKKSKANNGNSIASMPDDDDDMDDDDDVKMEEEHANGRKMTDEEKRKNFLERNRVAALKCRQRKKQWLANLQAKVELFSTENDALSATVTQLREEIVSLKTLLLAHKECPVSQAQGLSGMAMNQFIGDVQQHTNPYGMGMPPQQPMQMMQQQGQMQRS